MLSRTSQGSNEFTYFLSAIFSSRISGVFLHWCPAHKSFHRRKMDSYNAILTPIMLLIILIILLSIYSSRNFLYWKIKGISYFSPLPFIGNLKEVVTFQRNIGFHLKYIYDSMKDEHYKGFFIFDQPALMVKNLDLLKKMLQKDFQYFVDKGISLTRKDKLLRDALFCLKAQEWKQRRLKLSPAFSASKLKAMYEIVNEKANTLTNHLDSYANSDTPVLAKDLFGRYTTDIVASLAFSIDCNCLNQPNADFRKNLKNAFLYSKLGALKFIGAFVDLPLLRLWHVKTAPPEVVRFFENSVWNAIRERKIQPCRANRRNYLEMLLDVSNPEPDVKNSSDHFDIVSQAFTFLAAGFETTSSTILFTIYHLAISSNIQNKLRDEIQAATKNTDGKLSYDLINSLHYLDMVVSEILRLYPTMPMIDRTCTTPYTIPGTEITIDEGTHVFTSLLGIHRDPNFYPNPDNFDPDRFSEENKNGRHRFAYMPFGEGPRFCIGKRMGLMIVKNAITHIILKYEILPCKNTPQKLEFDVRTFLLTTSHEIPLVFRKLK